jgi:AcrR family transcriptional regulator
MGSATKAEQAGEVVSLDGRRARSARSREAAADAILDLLNEGARELPSAAQVAERSGLSTRTVFRLFDDLESLHAAAILRQRERLGPNFVFVPTEGDLEARLTDLVAHRVRLYESILYVRPFTERLRHSSEAIGSMLQRIDGEQRHQLRHQFDRELSSVAPAVRIEVLDALVVATSWAGWDVLRNQQGRSRARAQRTMTRQVRAVLSTT